MKHRVGLLFLTASMCLFVLSDLTAFSLAPEVCGNSSADSVLISFETFDTTAHAVPVDVDSLRILQFGPSGDLVDSLGEEDGRVTNPRTGSYEIRLRASDSAGTAGCYNVRVYVSLGADIRGAGSHGYFVKEQNWTGLDSIAFNLKAVLDTLNDGFASQHNQSSLDTTISSRSSLDSADNIGIDWGNMINTSAIQDLSATEIYRVEQVADPIEVDSSAVARAVWDNDVIPRSGRTVAFDNLGSGAYPCSLSVFSSTDSSALQGVALRLTNSEQSATVAVGLTDQNGRAVFALDSGQYFLWSYKVGISFGILPDTLLQDTQVTRDTIWGSAFDPGDPAVPELCRVYGWVHDLAGQPVTGATVSARLPEDNIRYRDYIISPYYKSTATDSLGYWEMDLYSNQLLQPSGSEYEFMIYYDNGRIARRRVTVPDQAGWQLSW